MNTYQGYNPVSATKAFFENYANFKGRATASAYWMWIVANWIISMILSVLSALLTFAGSTNSQELDLDSFGMGDFVVVAWSLATMIPSLALAVRRLHDTGRSGMLLIWFALACIVAYGLAIFGIIVLVSDSSTFGIACTIGGFAVVLAVSIYFLVLMCKDSQKGTNKWGPSEKYPEEKLSLQ